MASYLIKLTDTDISYSFDSRQKKYWHQRYLPKKSDLILLYRHGARVMAIANSYGYTAMRVRQVMGGVKNIKRLTEK